MFNKKQQDSDVKSGGDAKSSDVKKTRTKEEVDAKLKSCFRVDEAYWDVIPKGSRIYFFKSGPENRLERFRSGGYVRYIETREKDSKQEVIFQMETQPGGARGRGGYTQFPMYKSELDEIWKEYNTGSSIEIMMIISSLAKKNEKINQLEQRVASLEQKLSKFSK